MSANSTYNISIDSNISQEADALFRSMGLSLSSAINLFLKQAIIQEKLPITEIIAEPAYGEALLRDALETEAAIKNGTAKIYESPDELFASWEEADE